MKRQRLSLRTRKPLLTHHEPANACLCVWRARLRADNNAPATCGPGNSSCFFVLFFSCCTGRDEEPFRHVRQHDGQREKQDGGHAQKLCEFAAAASSAPLVWILLRALSVRSCVLCFRRACPPIPTRTRSTPRQSWRTPRSETRLPKCFRPARQHAALPEGWVVLAKVDKCYLNFRKCLVWFCSVRRSRWERVGNIL